MGTVIIFGIILFPPIILFLTSIKTDLDALSSPPKVDIRPYHKKLYRHIKNVAARGICS